MKNKIFLSIILLAFVSSSSLANPIDNSQQKKPFFKRTIQLKDTKNIEPILNKYGCLSCHSIYPPPKSAPPFFAIKRRYIRYFRGNIVKAKEYVKNRIKNGSKGNWYRFRNLQMPPYPNIPEKDLDKIVNAIFSVGF
jgi:cytochrome c551/c552